MFDYLAQQCLLSKNISLDKGCIDSTVAESNIAPPCDSNPLNDCVRVRCRLMKKSAAHMGVEHVFTNHRKAFRSFAFRIFNAKRSEKPALYAEFLPLVRNVIASVETALVDVEDDYYDHPSAEKWLTQIAH